MNQQTKDQLFAVILLSCIEQTNAEGHLTQEAYDIALRARLKSRTQPQQEMAL